MKYNFRECNLDTLHVSKDRDKSLMKFKELHFLIYNFSTIALEAFESIHSQ